MDIIKCCNEFGQFYYLVPQQNCKQIFINNVKKYTTEEELTNIFKDYGNITKLFIVIRNKYNKCFIHFEDAQDVNNVLEKKWFIEQTYNFKIYKAMNKDYKIDKYNSHTTIDRIKQTAKIFDLHDDIMIEIFRLLPCKDLLSVERTCSKWRDIAFHNIKNLKIYDDIDKNIFCHILHKVPLLKNITIITSILPYYSFPYLVSCCKFISRIEIRSDNLKDESLKRLSYGCKSLNTLILCSNSITDKGIKKILHNCKLLKNLNIAQCSGVDGDCFNEICDIECLNVIKCYISTNGITNIKQFIPKLKRLIIDIYPSDVLTFDIILNISTIRELYIMTTYIDADIFDIVPKFLKCKNLEYFEIYYSMCSVLDVNFGFLDVYPDTKRFSQNLPGVVRNKKYTKEGNLYFDLTPYDIRNLLDNYVRKL